MMTKGIWVVCAFVISTAACGEDDQQGSVPLAVAFDVAAQFPPAGKVMTPSGRLVDQACVFEVPQGAKVKLNGDVTKDDVVIDHHEPCTREQMGLSSDAALPPTIGHAWVDYTWDNAQIIDGVSYFSMMTSGGWTVPPNPSANGAILYLFPSFESTNFEIVQPVLQWGYNGDFGGNYWTMAAWYCSATQCPHSTAVTTAAGHALTGSMVSANPSWVVNINDNTSVTNTGFETPYTSNPISDYIYAQGAVLEVYNVSSCSQYPSTGLMSIRSAVYQAGPNWYNQNLVVPSWSNNTTGGLTPACSYGASNLTYSDGTSSSTVYFGSPDVRVGA